MSKYWTPAQSNLVKGVNGLSLDDVSVDTAAVVSKFHPTNPPTEPLVPPIYHSSTYIVKSVDHYLDILKQNGYIYSRLGNISAESVESAIHTLEGGAGTVVFSSGMGAITTALTCFLKAGDHMVANNPIYSGVYVFIRDILAKFGVDVTFVSAGCPVEEYKKQIRPNTRVLYGETPCNPDMSILDLEEFGKLGKSYENIMTIVDSTFGGPYLQQPLKYGIDASMHSCTKYIGGHSDLVAGCVTVGTVQQWQELKVCQTTMGSVVSPHDASLILRGLKTLPIRMVKHSENAQKVAEYLYKHPKVNRVMYPGLPSDPGYAVAKKQMKLFGGMLGIEVKGGLSAGRTLVESTRVFNLAVSLGGVESLIEHPASMTHGPMVMDDQDRRDGNITDGMIRISIGIEDADDLIRDLKQALEKVIIAPEQ